MAAPSGTDLRDAVLRDGTAIASGVLREAACVELEAALADLAPDGAGRRNLLDVPAVAELARSAEMRDLVTPVLGEDAFAVRGILFDKRPSANWRIRWHQDLTIAVRERADLPGFQGWSTKAGVTHVVAPDAVLEGMLAVRLHLDPTDARNGALEVVPGSHRDGRRDGPPVRHRTIVCAVGRGGAQVMRPLLVHRSGKTIEPRRRRVVHVEFAATPLPGGLQWASRVR